MKSVFAFLSLSLCLSAAHAASTTDGLPPAVVTLHQATTVGACDADLTTPPETHDLGQGNTLYIVQCMMGAYQGSARVYTTDASGHVSQVMVLELAETPKKAVFPTLDLGEAAYDAKTQTLSTFAKGRGVGDCGQSSGSKITINEYGTLSVKTFEIRSKLACDGKMTTWPVMFKQ